MFSLVSVTITPVCPPRFRLRQSFPINIPAAPRVFGHPYAEKKPKPAVFGHNYALPKNREGSEEEDDGETTKDGYMLEMKKAFNSACLWMGLTMESVHRGKFQIYLEKGNEHTMFLNVLQKAIQSPDPDAVFKENFPLVESKVIMPLFFQLLAAQAPNLMKRGNPKDKKENPSAKRGNPVEKDQKGENPGGGEGEKRPSPTE